MPYPVCVFIQKSDGSYFQVRDSDLALINEWKWNASLYTVRDFAIDTLGNIFFAKRDTYVRKHAEDGTQLKVVSAPSARYTYQTVLNPFGYACNLQSDSDGVYNSIRGYTKDDNLNYASLLNCRLTNHGYPVYGGLVFDDESIFYVSRTSYIEKWTSVTDTLLDTIDISPWAPYNLILIGDYLVFGTTGALWKINKGGGALIQIPMYKDAVTGGDPEDHVNGAQGVHVGRIDSSTFVVTFQNIEGANYIRYLRKYNLAGNQIGDTIDLGVQNYVSLGSYFNVGEVSPFVETLEVSDIVATEGEESATFNANLTNGTGKCVMKGFQYYDVLTPGTVRNITISSAYCDNGEYSNIVTSYLTIGHTYMVRAKVQNAIELVYGDWVEFYMGISVINIRAENSSTFARTILYGEILVVTGVIVERGFEYKIQDAEPAAGDSGTEVKETKVSGFAIGEYSLKNRELYDQQYIADNIVWWFRAYCKDGGANKYVATSWMKNLPNVITQDMTNINYNKADGNGLIVSEGASELTERGFEVKHEYSGSFPASWKFEIAGFEGEVEAKTIVGAGGVITDFYWAGVLIKTVLETTGLVVGAYLITIGEMEFGWPVMDNCLIEGKAYKCRAFAENEFGRVYGEEVDFSTWTRTYFSENPPTIGELTIVKNEIIENLPVGITASRRGFRYGTTETADEFDVHENGSFTNGLYSMMLSDLLPNTTYYIVAYIVVNGIVYEGSLETITTDAEDTEDSDEYPTPHYSPQGQDYREMETKVFAEVLASQGIIDFSGGKKTLPITNHLIQTNPSAKTIADSYLNRFKLAKTRMTVTFPTPLPFEREDTVDFSYGALLFKEDDKGVVHFKENGTGVSVLMNQISMIIKKINSVGLAKTETSVDYMAVLDLEHE